MLQIVDVKNSASAAVLDYGLVLSLFASAPPATPSINVGGQRPAGGCCVANILPVNIDGRGGRGGNERRDAADNTCAAADKI